MGQEGRPAGKKRPGLIWGGPAGSQEVLATEWESAEQRRGVRAAQAGGCTREGPSPGTGGVQGVGSGGQAAGLQGLKGQEKRLNSEPLVSPGHHHCMVDTLCPTSLWGQGALVAAREAEARSLPDSCPQASGSPPQVTEPGVSGDSAVRSPRPRVCLVPSGHAHANTPPHTHPDTETHTSACQPHVLTHAVPMPRAPLSPRGRWGQSVRLAPSPLHHIDSAACRR